MYILFFGKTSYLNEEVNCTDPCPLVRIPCSFIVDAAGKPYRRGRLSKIELFIKVACFVTEVKIFSIKKQTI